MAAVRFGRIIGQSGLKPGFRRALLEHLLLDKNLLSQHVGQIRWIPLVTETIEFCLASA
jgi:hypothetical protein